MFRVVTLLVLGCLSTGMVSGMECNFGQSSNIFEKITNTCPLPFQSSEKSFCCFDVGNGKSYCCDGEEFTLKIGFLIIMVILIICGLSCLCRCCCGWYRRRHQGTVYGRVQAPSIVHVIQTPANPTHSQYTWPATAAAGATAQPAYTNEVYPKQAPYNPNYVQ